MTAAGGGGMIRAKKLHEILAGRLGGGVRAAMVFNHDGALLGAASLPPASSASSPGSSAPASPGLAPAGGGAGETAAAGGDGAVAAAAAAEAEAEAVLLSSSKAGTREAQIMAAVTSHIWATYEGMGIEPGQPLETLIFELEGARIVALPAGPHHLVSLVGTGTAEVGLLLTKAQALGEYLREAFRQVPSL